MSEYIHVSILPQMAKKEREISLEEGTNQPVLDSNESEEAEKEKILKQYGLTVLCLSTVANWMNTLGFRYDYRRKGFYFDGHEKEATVAYRQRFCERYLEGEKKMLRWIQIDEKEAKQYEENGELAEDTGYRYTDDATGKNMVEYHVDDCDDFHKIMERETAFGGRRSVRFTEDEPCTVIIGHDEAVIKQFLLTKKGWFGPNGEMGLVPKDEGHGLMLSGFVSRELGFGWEISEVQYREIKQTP